MSGEKSTVERNSRKTMIGIVTSAKTDKTRRVEVERLQKHPKYGKYLKRHTVCFAHDETNVSKEGDRVEIMSTRPLSKLKRWRIVRVVAEGGAGSVDSTSYPAGGAEADTDGARPTIDS